MLEMLKSKTIVGFIIIVLGISFIGGNNQNQILENNQNNNISITD